MKQIKEIRHYGYNRRLYDTDTSKYITYLDIHKYLVNDIEFTVISDKANITDYIISVAISQLFKQIKPSRYNATELYHKIHMMLTMDSEGALNE